LKDLICLKSCIVDVNEKVIIDYSMN